MDRIAGRLAQARRDVAAVRGRLRGQRAPFLVERHGPRPSPLTRGAPSRSPATAGNGTWIDPQSADGPPLADGVSAGARIVTRPVRVVEIVRETADAVSIYLDEPGAELRFRPGQFLTFEVALEEGGSARRAYSLASPALEGRRPHVTVKRVGGGRVSNYLNDTVRAGQTLHVLGPSGSFVLDPADAGTPRHVVFVAGGSGITPIISMIETLLETEPLAEVTLLYGNRSEADIIFRERLSGLSDRHPQRLRVDHVLEKPEGDWGGARGRLDSTTLAERLSALAHVDDASIAYFVCGPTPMMTAVSEALSSMGVDRARIREESFARPEERVELGPDVGPQSLILRTGSGVEVEALADGETLLEAGLAAGVKMPFSCALGGCGACKVRLVEGTVAMEEPNCLTPEERARGYVLACVAHASTPCILELEP